MLQQPYRFVGGKYDGAVLPVPGPVPAGVELRVRSVDPVEPSQFYVLREDGCFHLDPAIPSLLERALQTDHPLN